MLSGTRDIPFRSDWTGTALQRFAKLFAKSFAKLSAKSHREPFAKSISVLARRCAAADLSIRLMESLEKPLIERFEFLQITY
jgi:hypothetical protein